MQTVSAGATITLDLFVSNSAGPLDADEVRIDIVDPNAQTVVNGAEPTRQVKTGHYQYDFEVPADAPLGIWTANWTAVVEGQEFPGTDEFQVVSVAELEFGFVPVATVTELEEYCRTSFDAAASVVAAQVIDYAQGTLETYLGRPVTLRTFVDVVDLDRTADAIYFSSTPVVAIQELSVDGTIRPSTSYRQRKWGISDHSFSGEQMTVTYRAGVNGRHRDHSSLKFAVLRAAKREMQHYAEGDFGLEDIRSEGYAVKFVAPDAVFTKQELAGVQRYKRRTVA